MTKLPGLAASAERADDHMVDEKIPAEIRKLTFEEALAELEDIVRGLETGSGDLDGAIEAYARGVQLKRHCEARLKDAQAKIDKIVKASGGEIATEPLDAE